MKTENKMKALKAAAWDARVAAFNAYKLYDNARDDAWCSYLSADKAWNTLVDACKEDK